MALVKYNNNSLSAITTPGAMSAGAMTLIKEQTASSSATISFVDGTSDVDIDATYPIYLIKIINAHPASDDQHFNMQFNSSGGSGFNETITSTHFYAMHEEDDGGTTLTYDTGGDQAQGTSYQRLSQPVGADNDQSLSGEIWLFNPSSTTFVKPFISRVCYSYPTDEMQEAYVAGYINTTSAIDEVSFKFTSGNIDSGTFKLYGIKDS